MNFYEGARLFGGVVKRLNLNGKERESRRISKVKYRPNMCEPGKIVRDGLILIPEEQEQAQEQPMSGK